MRGEEKAGETVGVSGDAFCMGSRIYQIYGQGAQVRREGLAIEVAEHHLKMNPHPELMILMQKADSHTGPQNSAGSGEP